jgi:phosphoglycolate phosphatase
VIRPFVVGFDLDLTLVDSRPGIAATLRALSAHTGVFVDADAAVRRLGPPLEDELALWFPRHEVAGLCDLFREFYPEHAVTVSPALRGAAESFAAVRAAAGRIVVITGKYRPNAQLHLNHLGLVADAVVGWAWAQGKVEAMEAHGVGVYVGDHPADMAAARAVAHPAMAVGVLTGEHTAAELLDAGADAVLADLSEFPRWLDDHWNATGISVGLAQTDR